MPHLPPGPPLGAAVPTTAVPAAVSAAAGQRSHARAAIELKVEYKKMNSFFSDYTKNIGKGGTFIKTEKPLKIGTEFVFQLVVPARSEPFSLRGRVAWIHSADAPSEHLPADHEHGMGIRFIYADEAQRRGFESCVEDLMKDSLGPHVFQQLMDRTR